ncbi:hypothetical protein E5198_12095 [Pseudomonas sp. A-1]|uniref:YmfL family putative regulatory protein n=1 Tax=Pseudomonas sp. A-1 TaxID=1821274 RepID=UPI0010A67642|nr:YmfL family putative regulatory protein [Pseudomonas sp. A-1]THG81490.1 hypothetical protein E5198_12095 [Pseudomonas sp. A-1]
MKRPLLETRRQVMSAVICAYPGGRECAAALLGLQLKKLDNAAYEAAGHRPLSDEQVHMLEQQIGTTFLPDYICGLYGGVFVPMADAEQLDNVALYAMAMDAEAKRGAVARLIAEALDDGELDEGELAEIVAAHRKHIAAEHAEVEAVITLHRRAAK